VSPFLKKYDAFDPETLAILTISLDATCAELQHNPCLDQTSARAAIADLIMKIASRGQSDPQKIKALALAAFRSHCYGPSKNRLSHIAQ
jgi:hypothetical protein